MKKTSLLIGFIFLCCFLSSCANKPPEETTTPTYPTLQQAQNAQASLSIKPDPPAATEEQNFTQIKLTNRIPIFMFHYVRTVDKKKDLLGYDLSVDTETLDSMLRYLKENGYKTIHVADILEGVAPEKAVILSFDDGYEDFYSAAFPLLQKYNLTASTAIITGKTGTPDYMTNEQIKEIHAAGIEILAHSVTHPDLIKDKDEKSEIFGSKDYLEKLLNTKIIGFVYPSGDYDASTIKLVKQAGFQAALTTRPGYAELEKDLFQLHRIRIDNRYGLDVFIKDLTNTPPTKK